MMTPANAEPGAGAVEPLRDAIGRRFSRAAASYDRAAWHQAQAAEALCRALPETPAPQTVLEWGCGTGLLTRRLVARWPRAELIALDIASGMLDEARRRLPAASAVRWVHADAERYRPPQPVDLLVSNCAVQWFARAGELGRLAAGVVSDAGRILLSMPAKGTMGELWQAFADVGLDTSAALPLWSPETCRISFDSSQWCEVRIWTEIFVAHHADARDVLSALRRIGATARAPQDSRDPLSPAVLRRVMAAYNQRFRTPDGTVPCTYPILFVAARRRAGHRDNRDIGVDT